MKLILLTILIAYTYGHQNQNFDNIVNPSAQPHLHKVDDVSRGQIPLWDKYGNADFMHDLK